MSKYRVQHSIKPIIGDTQILLKTLLNAGVYIEEKIKLKPDIYTSKGNNEGEIRIQFIIDFSDSAQYEELYNNILLKDIKYLSIMSDARKYILEEIDECHSVVLDKYTQL